MKNQNAEQKPMDRGGNYNGYANRYLPFTSCKKHSSVNRVTNNKVKLLPFINQETSLISEMFLAIQHS